MKHIILFKVYKGNQKYVGEGVDVSVVTQGDTIEEVVANIKEALTLHFEEEDLKDLDLAPHPSVMVNYELDFFHA